MAVKNINTISERTIWLRQGFPIKTVKPIAGKAQHDSQVNKDEAWYKKSFREFCNATALHGYSYIVRPEASLCERYVIFHP